MSGHPYITLTKDNVGQSVVMIEGSSYILSLSSDAPSVLPSDVGRRVYLIGGHAQLESDAQYAKRMRSARTAKSAKRYRRKGTGSLILDYEEHGGRPVDLLDALSVFSELVEATGDLVSRVKVMNDVLTEPLRPDTRRQKFLLRLSDLVAQFEKFGGVLNRMLLMQPLPAQSEIEEEKEVTQ